MKLGSILQQKAILFALVIVSFMALGTLQAQTTADIAGQWRGYSMSTPNAYTLFKDSQSLVTSVQPLMNYEYNDENITINVNGSFSGGASGTFAYQNGGTVIATVTSPDPGTTTFRVNRSNDVMVAVEKNSTSQDMIFLMRSPASVLTSQVGGTWTIYSFRTPSFISLDRADSGFPGVVTAIQGGNQFGVVSGTMTVNGANGAISGTLQGPFTGQVGSYNGAQLNVSITPSGELAFNLPMYINNSKDIMIAMQQSSTTDDNRMEFLLFVKAPSSTPTTGNYKGNWRITTFDTPANLNTTTDGKGHVMEIQNRDAFAVDNTQYFTVGSDAFVTAQVDTPAIGNISVPSASQLVVSLTHPDNSAGGATLTANAGLNFLVATDVNGYNQELIIAMRGPQGTGTTKQMGLLFFNGAMYWATDTGRKLQTTGDVNVGGWADVSGTSLTHTFAPVGTTNQFFRVVE